MPVLQENLWPLVRKGQPIDASALAGAIEREAIAGGLDFRTRLLIRDGLEALGRYWGQERLAMWLAASPACEALARMERADLGPPGFPSLGRRIMDATRSETVLEFLRELGGRISRPARLDIGGAIALILAGNLSRNTEDIDVVDEVPPEVRMQYDLLREMDGRYGLHIAHFQSHYLPAGWNGRLRYLGQFGQLEVWLVDPCDVFVGKMFSPRAKDRDDLRALKPQFEKSLLTTRLRDTAAALLADERLAKQAAENWYILYGEPLPA